MYKGTTPTYTFTGPAGLDLTGADNIYVTFAGNKTLLTKTGDDLVITTETVEGEIVSSVGVYLTQEETLRLPVGVVNVQLNWTYQEGGKVKRAASDRISITVKHNLLEKVIE